MCHAFSTKIKKIIVFFMLADPVSCFFQIKEENYARQSTTNKKKKLIKSS